MDIPDKFQQVLILLTQHRFVSILKEISRPLMASVEGNGISGKNLPHEGAERMLAGSDEKMNVIVEQDPGVTERPGLREPFLKPIEKVFPVSIIKEDILPVQASDHHMMNSPWYIDSLVSWHKDTIPSGETTVNKLLN